MSLPFFIALSQALKSANRLLRQILRGGTLVSILRFLIGVLLQALAISQRYYNYLASSFLAILLAFLSFFASWWQASALQAIIACMTFIQTSLVRLIRQPYIKAVILVRANNWVASFFTSWQQASTLQAIIAYRVLAYYQLVKKLKKADRIAKKLLAKQS